MRRMYERAISKHFRKNRQMLFVMGPRQVGKTTLSLHLQEEWPRFEYLNWDNSQHRKLIKAGEEALAERFQLGSSEGPIPLIAFDELHKYRKWKNYLKGLYDTYPSLAHILVTGSARLDVYQKGADSLMGRFFRYRVHPLSVREIAEPEVLPLGLRAEPVNVDPAAFETLWQYGGFPDPFFRADADFARQWRLLRSERLFREDLKDLSHVRELSQIEILAEFLSHSVGSLTSYSSLSRQVGVSHPTIQRWIKWLGALYYCFEIHPYTANIARSLVREPKYYLTDWSALEDPGARAENFIASHLLKATHFWTDSGIGTFRLHFVRDRHKREVDFLITRDKRPWCLVEVKVGSSYAPSPSLFYFQEQLRANYALQVVFGKSPLREPCFIDERPRVVSAIDFLSQLV